MLFVKLVRFLLGYIRIRISGDYQERFLNLCAGNGITVWNVRRRDEAIECCMLARDYKFTRKLRRRCGAKLRVKKRRGVPFIVRRYRHRPGLLVGLVLFIAFLSIMPRFVWSVEVVGGDSTNTSDILNAAERSGIKLGARVSNLDVDNLRPMMLVELPELSWAAINIEGSMVTIDVREQLDPQRMDDKSPCNLVADYDGQVTAVYIKRGNATVKIGDAVRKGDLLATGTVEYGDTQTVMCHAYGEVYASTERRLTITSPMTVQKAVPTGKIRTKRVLQLFGLHIPLYLGSEQYSYTCKAEEKALRVFDVTLPVSVTMADFSEVQLTKSKISSDEAKKNALAELEQLEKQQLDGKKIISRKLSYEKQGDNIVLTADYCCEENIAIESALSIVD